MTLIAHKSPYKMRPIVCCAGTFMNCRSKWLDYYLQKLKPYVTTFVHDTTYIIEDRKSINNLPPNTFILNTDANAMYNNMNTNYVIEVIILWIIEMSQRADFPKDFPVEAVINAMKIILTNNYFEFGNLNMLQLLGTTMGTSATITVM